MKPTGLSLLLLCCSLAAMAESRPDRQLVEEYIKQSRIEQVVTAEVEGYAQQYKQFGPEENARMLEYLNGTMGWKTVKEQYASLIEKTYTSAELKAAIAFIKSGQGASMTAKAPRFAHDLSVLMAANSQQFATKLAAAKQSDDEEVPREENVLAARNVDERNLQGNIYFTGEVENRGKRPARGVEVEVNLFSGDKFVDQYTTYISGVVPPGGRRYFKVSCGCKDLPPAPHDSFKVQVIESY